MLQFSDIKDTGKTKQYSVGCNNDYLGIIKWYAPWRRYTFFPKENTLFDNNCLKEIINFIDNQMKLRK
jgi:hypothetical protein